MSELKLQLSSYSHRLASTQILTQINEISEVFLKWLPWYMELLAMNGEEKLEIYQGEGWFRFITIRSWTRIMTQ